MTNALTTVGTDLMSLLAMAGINAETELMQEADTDRPDIPRVMIEHRKNGRHRLYLDLGESYLDQDHQELDLPGNRLEAIVISEQFIRSLWAEGEARPVCSGINNQPNVENPVNFSCIGCRESVIGQGNCKPKVRLLILTRINGDIRAVGFNLPPTSIKHWIRHKNRTHRTNVPLVALNTVFTLEGVEKNGYKWAEVTVSADGIADRELLMLAKQAREELRFFTEQIGQRDFSDPGDKALPF